MMWYLGLFFVVIVASIAAPYIFHHTRGKSWSAMARRLGLTYHDLDVGGALLGYESDALSSFRIFDRNAQGICQVDGSLSGVHVSARADIHGWGRNRHVRTYIEVSYPGQVPHDLSLTPEGLLAKLGKLVGGQDIQTGDAELDRAFVIRGALEEEVIPYLRSPRVRAGLLAIKRRYSGMCFDRRGVQIEVRGFWSAERLEEALHFISGHVKHMAEGAPQLEGHHDARW